MLLVPDVHLSPFNYNEGFPNITLEVLIDVRAKMRRMKQE